MAEQVYESRFVCKLCFKKYPCGKSLGGHMRSHVVANSAEFHGEFGNGQSSYGLRENPKKTWRVRPPSSQDSVCRQCGKGFATRKALSGHMASHSSKDKSSKDDQSWTSENHKVVVSDNDSQSDTEGEEMRRIRTRSRFCDDDSQFLVVNYGGSSSVSDQIDGQEQEEVAMCLMMLSRDFANVNSVVESSDNNSVVMETKSCSAELRNGRLSNECRKLKGSVFYDKTAKVEDSDSGYFLDECGKAESEVSVDWFRRNRRFEGGVEGHNAEVKKSLNVDSKLEGIESRKREVSYEDNYQKKSKYECFNCKKVFKSYQALGGHRPCHKRINESRDESGENTPGDSTCYKKSSAKNLSKTSKGKGHVCPFCNRVFKNGQALGGHKRSHFIGENRSPVVKPDSPDLLDLNLPAPEANEDDGSGRVFSW